MASIELPLGRYILFDAIASGGMASVHFGRMVGPAGFARTVAIKRLHPHLAHDNEFATMFLDEARLAVRVQHPNVVQTLDVVALDGELLLVMEYIRGETLSRLLTAARERGEAMPQRALSAVILGTLYGLDAAHEAKREDGTPLGIVHRDVSPQNVLVGEDGVARVVDFGVAKAASRAHSTRDGAVKGKLSYMAIEQLKRLTVDRRADVYAVGVMLWEGLAGRKLFSADDALAVMDAVVHAVVPPIASVASGVSPDLAAIVHRALNRDADARFPTAMAMAEALERAVPPAPPRELAAYLKEMLGPVLDARAARLSEIESSTPTRPTKARVDPDVLALTEQATALMPPPKDGSAVTGVSVVQDATVRRRSRWPLLTLLACAIALGGAGLWRMRPTRAPATAPAIASTAIASTASTASFTATASSTSSSPPRTSAPPVQTLAAPAQTHAAPARTVRISKPKCNPPVYVDSTGIEHIKPECL